ASSLFLLPHLPDPTLFPYTTLFRSPLPPGGTAAIRPAQAPYRPRSDKGPAGWLSCVSNASWLFFPPLFIAERQTQTLPCSAHFRSEEHTSELQSRFDLVCRLLLEKK